LQRRAKRRRHHQRQHQQRQSLQDIHDALDDEIDPATEVTGGETEDDAEPAPQRRRTDPDRERNARAVDDPRVNVARFFPSIKGRPWWWWNINRAVART